MPQCHCLCLVVRRGALAKRLALIGRNRDMCVMPLAAGAANAPKRQGGFLPPGALSAPDVWPNCFQYRLHASSY